MMNLQDYIITENITVLAAMAAIDRGSRGAVYVCEGLKLKGVVTDGDIRRFILNHGNVAAPVKEVANYHPLFLPQSAIGKLGSAEDFMREHKITSVPVTDDDTNVILIEFSNNGKAYKCTELDIPVVIMAGGKGERLQPFTRILPKPLFPIGDRTITELIMDRFAAFNCNRFTVIVNYKRDLIKSYFKDTEMGGEREVAFIDETEFLGTGGGLTLLPDFDSTSFMTNCDILVDTDYSSIVAFHRKNRNIITMVCALKNTTLPYGSVEISGNGQVLSFMEKPSYSHMVNTGFYLIEPEFLRLIPRGKFVHITDVIQNCIKEGRKVGAYPISDSAWFDMGQFEEMEKMKEKLNLNE